MERIDEEMKIIERNINELINAEYNPRKLSKDQEKALMDSLTRFGVVDPVIVNTHPERENIIVGGHQRCKVWEKLGNDTIPTVEVSLSYDKERELNVRLNKNTGEFDWDLLNDHFESQELLDWGFEINELDFKIDNGEAEEDDYEMPDEVETDIVYGDIIEIGPHRLMCGDSTNTEDVEKLMNGIKADMVFTDPPYALFGNSTGVADVADDKMIRPFFRDIFLRLKHNIKIFGHIYICCDWHSAFTIEAMSREVEIKAKNLCIWDKGDGGVGAMYQQCYEMIWLFDNSPKNKTTSRTVKAGVRTVNGKPNIWRYKRVLSDRKHNAQKPVEMIAFAISNSSDKNNTVLDLFGGSGSTMVAANQINRKCIMMEMEPKYCQVIIDRMQKLDPSLEVKVNGLPYHQEEIVA